MFNCIHPKVGIVLVAFTPPSLDELKLYSYTNPFLTPEAETKIFTYSFSLYIMKEHRDAEGPTTSKPPRG